MAIRPIIFSAPMIRALLGGTKTQTRRVLKPQPYLGRLDDGSGYFTWGRVTGLWPDDWPEAVERNVHFGVGDLLYVRETWARTRVAPIVETIDKPWIVYRECDNQTDYGGPWKPSIHMPREFSRITLKVTGVKVERVQDISEEDAKAEGVRLMRDGGGTFVGREGPGRMVTPWPTAKEAFADLWDSINADRGYGWLANPWVVCVSFEVIKANVDSLSNPGPGD